MRTPSRARPTWSPRSTGPRSADRRAAPAPPGPTTASSARRATDRTGHQRRPLDHRPDRRHHQLPLRPARLRRARSPPAVDDGRGGRRGGRTRSPSELFTATRGGGATCNGEPIALRRATDLVARRSSPPASPTTPSGGAAQADGRSARLIGRGPRHPPGRRGRARPVLGGRRPARRATSSRAWPVGPRRRRAGRPRGRAPSVADLDGGPPAGAVRRWPPPRAVRAARRPLLARRPVRGRGVSNRGEHRESGR